MQPCSARSYFPLILFGLFFRAQVPFDAAEKAAIEQGNASLMRAGERVLGFAQRRLPRGKFEPEGCIVRDEEGKDTGTRTWGDADTKKGQHANQNGDNWGPIQQQQARDARGVLQVDEDGKPVMEGKPWPYVDPRPVSFQLSLPLSCLLFVPFSTLLSVPLCSLFSVPLSTAFSVPPIIEGMT